MALYIPHHNLLSIVSFIIFPSSPKKNSEEKMKLLNSATLILFLTMIVVSSAMDMSIISYDKNHHTVSSRSDAEVSRLYEEWLVKHGKAQNSLTEKDRRFEIFKDNLRFIDEHNGKNLSYRLGLTKFADLTNDEYRSMYLGSRLKRKATKSSLRYEVRVGDAIPESVDWRKEGAVAEVKDQGSCGKFSIFINYL